MALDVVTTEYNIEIEKSKQALNDLEKSYQKSEKAGAASASKVTGAFQKTAGILENLNAHLQSLEKRRDKAMNPSTIQIFNKRIDETRAKIQALTQATEKSGGSMVNTFKQVAASVGIAFSVQTLLRFGKEMVNLALDAEEVKMAFARLNQPELLDDLRKAVSGTVDDVTLMRQTLKAEKLGVPVEQLASAFEFAERRSGELGLTTEALIEQIVQGIGSKSTRAFTTMGISSLRVQDALKGLNAETATTADIMKAMGEIFDEELGKMGPAIESNSDKVAKLNAEWTNFKTKAGGAILSVLGPMGDLIDKVGGLESVLTGLFNTATGGFFGLSKIISGLGSDDNVIKQLNEATLAFPVDRLTQINNELKTNAMLLGMKSDAQTKANLESARATLEEEKKQIILERTSTTLEKLEKRQAELELQMQTQLINTPTYNKLLAEYLRIKDQITVATGGETEAMKKNAEELKKQREERQRDIMAFAELIETARKMRQELFGESNLEAATNFAKMIAEVSGDKSGIGAVGDELDKQQKERADKFIRDTRARLQLEADTVNERIELLQFEKDQELSNTELTHNERLAIIKKYAALEMQVRIDAAVQIVTSLNAIFQGLNEVIEQIGKKRLDIELDLIEKQKEAQLASLDKQLENEKLTAKQRENLLKQRADTEAAFVKQTEAAREQAAKDQLKFTIAGIVLNQSAAIASAIAGAVAQAQGNPLGIAAILAITLPLILSGMAQALSAANAVELAEGEVGLKGPGTTKSDSIPARLSRGESVITAEGTKLDPDLLRAMNKGSLAFDNYVQHTYVWPYMEAMIKAHSKPERGFTFNDRNLLKELKTGNKLQIKSTNALLRAMYRSKSYRGERN